jgi:hypothetical protein
VRGHHQEDEEYHQEGELELLHYPAQEEGYE